MQTIENDLAPASAPANDNGGGSARRTSDSFVDAAMDAMSALGAPAEDQPQEQRARKQVRRDQEAPETDPGAEGDEQDALGEPEETEQGDEQGDAESEAAQEEDHDLRGSKDEPFTVKDLPGDKFIELKVDGEKVVVPLDELASGYIREATFTKWANKTKMLASEAEGMIAKARETKERVREELRSLLYNPDQLYDFFLASDDREQVFETAARKYAELRRLHRERPDERLAFQRRRDQERLAFERKQFEEQRHAEETERTKREQAERARAIFQPGWETGLRKAGFPDVSGPRGQALYDEVLVRCQQKHARGEQVTTEDITDFVVRAVKVLELPARGGKKRPAPAPVVSRPDNDNARRTKRDPWAGKSQREKVRDPEFFLRNLRGRDIR